MSAPAESATGCAPGLRGIYCEECERDAGVMQRAEQL